MSAIPLFVAAVLLSAYGATPAMAAGHVGTRSVTMAPEDCATQSLKWGDVDGDGKLTETEFVDLTLIAFDGTARIERQNLARSAKRKAKVEQQLAAAPDDASLKADLVECDEEREKTQDRLAKMGLQRMTYATAARKRFAGFDADRSGAIERAELVEACRDASKD